MRKTLILTLAAATALVGTAAGAQQRERGADMTRDAVAERAAAMFARIDANSDGRIDAADREARQDARFERLDTDNNGTISKAEFDAMHEAHKDRRGDRTAATGENRRGHAMRGRGGRGGGMHMFRGADTDNDSAISQAEFTAAMLARFDAADADNDGTVTRAERAAQMQERRTRRAAQQG